MPVTLCQDRYQHRTDSPTQRVGAVTTGALPKHIHQRPMLSLADAVDVEELAE